MSSRETSVAERIELLINELGESKASFAKKIGVTASTISTAIDRKKGVNTDLIQKIADAFTSISLDWLLTGHGDITRKEPLPNISIGDNSNKVNIGNRGLVVNEPMAHYETTPTKRKKSDELEKLKAENYKLQLENDFLKSKNELLEKSLADKEYIINMLSSK